MAAKTTATAGVAIALLAADRRWLDMMDWGAQWAACKKALPAPQR